MSKTKKQTKTKGRPATKNKGKSAQPQIKEYIVSPRVKAIIFGMLSGLFLALILIPGEMVWAGIRSFIFGIFGISVILLPIIFGYMAFINSSDKYISFLKTKIVLSSLVVLLTENLMFLIGSADYKALDYFSALGRLYSDIAFSNNYYPLSSGLLGGILGYPMLYACGQLAAIVVNLLLLVGLLLIIFKVSLRDVGLAMQKFSKKVTKRRVAEPLPEQDEEDLGIGHFQAESGYGIKTGFDSSIDIPIDGKKRKGKKQNIDIPVEDNKEDKSPLENFFDNIKKAEENYSEKEKLNEKDDLLSLDEVIQNVAKEETEKKENKIFDLAPEVNQEEDNPYTYPPVGLLKLANNKNVDGDSEMKENGEKLITTLSNFGVSATITYIARGPSVTRYEIKPAPGVRISKITNLSDDISLALAAKGVRIEAPIPGKAAVGIEVPNKVISTVSMRELIDSDDFKNHPSKLACVLGKDISGQIIITDISKMPHLLIAGTTGSGKSVCMNALLISILYRATPEEVKMLLIDPKMVEFSSYRGIPHLLVPVVTDPKKAAGALNWAVSEMEQRYKIFSEFSCKDIDSYNTLIQSNIEYMKENQPEVDEETGELVQPVLEVNGLPVAKEKMPRIVIAIDELADLMMTAPKEVEESIARLAQKARAAGMHLVIATQRPSVNVITGLIKANIPSRISLKVSSNIDSRTILDSGGAEKLIGSGDMLYSPVGAPNAVRVQCCYATGQEIESVTDFIKKSYKAEYNAEIEEQIKRIAAEDLSAEATQNEEGASALDAKMEEAIKVVIDAGQASTSMLQRRLQVGYARAGRMIDDMEKLGIVGPYQGSKPRDVLMSYNQWLERKNIIGNND